MFNVLTNTTLDSNFANNLKSGTTYTQVSSSLKAALLAVKPADVQIAAQIEKNLETVIDSYDRSPLNFPTPANLNPKNPPVPPNPPTPLYPNFLFPFADPSATLEFCAGSAADSAAANQDRFDLFFKNKFGRRECFDYADKFWQAAN